METNSFRNRLKECVLQILRPEDFHEELAPAIRDYTELLFEIGDIDAEREADRVNIETESGKAIGLLWAAFCVQELHRTQRFCKGLYKAIQEQIDAGKKQVKVLYAGTGPLATLALPSMLMFSPKQLQFTFIEINPESARRVKHVLEVLELSNYVAAIEVEDALKIQLKETDFDILISETMNRALSKEPQVPLMVNLVAQLLEDVVIIPEEIRVSLSRIHKNNPPVILKELLRFNKDYISGILRNGAMHQWKFERHLIENNTFEASELFLTTDIVVYKEEQLSFPNSSLNLPQKIYFPSRIAPESFSLQYEHIGRPKFELLLSEN